MIVEKIIRKLKNDPGYSWQSNYSSRELLVIISGRLWQILRGGMYHRWFLKHSRGFFFVGRNVKIKHAHLVSAGKNLILDDNVYVDALSSRGIIFGDNVSIARNSILVCTGVIAQKGTGIKIGNGTGINARAFLGGQGGITIGDDVIIGPDVRIFSENHGYSNTSLLIKEQTVVRKETIIGNNCWIGAGSTILAGVTIEEGCVIAAGSIVTKSFPVNVIIGGVPAKIIKSRI